MVTYTTTYNLKKPTVADDEDVWGGYLNDSMDLIDDVLDGTTPVTGIDINSGTIDNTVIGGTTPVAGTFTALTANTSLGVTGNITVSGTVDGRDVAADGTKLDGIEANADVTDTANVTAAGALMDSEVTNLAQVKAFSSSDYATAAQGTTADAALARSGGTMTGAITFATGQTFDGRDVSADGAKLDGIESGADVTDSANVQTAIGQNVGTTGDPSFKGLTLTDDGKTGTLFTIDADDASPWQIELTRAGAQSSKVFVNNTAWAFEHNPTYYNGGAYNRLLHTGDEGSGNGLDADTVDGYHASSFVEQLSDATSPDYQASSSRRVDPNNSNPTFAHYAITTFGNEGNVTGQLATHFQTGEAYTRGYNSSWSSWRKQWDSSNDGAGSGLDADLWDGNQFASYLNQAVLTTSSPTFSALTITNQLEMSNNLDMNNYDIYGVDQIFHHGDTNTYIQFHASDQFRVVTGGSERFEVNNTRTQADRLLVTSALAENDVALSGTSVTADPDSGGAFYLTMTGNTTFTFGAPALGNVSTGFIIELTGNGSTVTWPTSVDWAGGTAPDAPASGETDIYVFWTRDGGTTWYGLQSIDAAA